MSKDTLILTIARMFRKKGIVNIHKEAPDNFAVLKVRGFKYAYYKESEMSVKRWLMEGCKCKPDEMVDVSDYQSGEAIAKIRIDELFNF